MGAYHVWIRVSGGVLLCTLAVAGPGPVSADTLADSMQILSLSSGQQVLVLDQRPGGDATPTSVPETIPPNTMTVVDRVAPDGRFWRELTGDAALAGRSEPPVATHLRTVDSRAYVLEPDDPGESDGVQDAAANDRTMPMVIEHIEADGRGWRELVSDTPAPVSRDDQDVQTIEVEAVADGMARLPVNPEPNVRYRMDPGAAGPTSR